MNVYSYVADKVRSESDPVIRPYAEQLRVRYPEAIAGHEQQITNKTNALRNCKKELP